MKTKEALTAAVLLLSLTVCSRSGHMRAVAAAIPMPPASGHDPVFSDLASSWDEGVPLGNGTLGALIWRKNGALRVSLDRADLWDLRPIAEFGRPEFSFEWVRKHVLSRDYEPVHRMGDVPYDRDPAPSKIPAGALEIDIHNLGDVESVRLSLDRAVAEVRWKNGARLEAFVHAGEEVGWLRFEGPGTGDLRPRLVPPPYHDGQAGSGKDVVAGKSLASLGYPAPETASSPGRAHVRQRGWGGMSYDIDVAWGRKGAVALDLAWSVSSDYPGGGPVSDGPRIRAERAVADAMGRGFGRDLTSHLAWWRDYWSRCGLAVPDPLLEKQWYAEMYKFGSAARRGAPPITLQAVWTADNGSLPPWKGDIHNDLNTQLSYWLCYAGNHLEEGLSFLDWLWRIKPRAEEYTKRYFGVAGLNVPGVCALDGAPLGGWIQYSFGPTVSAWLAQHFYLHWQFSRDRKFLEERAYPWLRDTAVFLENISVKGPDGLRRLPLSSSPEINDDRIDAWFPETTNFDLSLIRWLFGAAADLAAELDKGKDMEHWEKVLMEWPELARAGDDGRLLVAPGYPLRGSHRHFSHLMAIHPLGLVDISNGDEDRRTIASSLAELDRLGPGQWCGYSYAWLASLAARAGDGRKAADALGVFARCFCLPNTFHVNGDQCRAGHSEFIYRPFTLEGNFAFAAALEEMLIQSHTEIIRLFPAVPLTWRDISFAGMRTYGAFIVSAEMRNGRVVRVGIVSERGGPVTLADPFKGGKFSARGPSGRKVKRTRRFIEADLAPGESFILTAE